MSPHRTKIILLKIVSWVFRIFGLGCVVFGIIFMSRVAAGRPGNMYYDTMPELYFMLLVASVFIPGIAGLFSFVVSGLIDLRVTILTYAN